MKPRFDLLRPAISADDGYLSKVIKYIPAEITAVYVFIAGIIAAGDENGDQLAFNFTLISLLVITPIWIYLGISSSNPLPPKRQRIFHAIVAMLALLVWVYNISINFTSCLFRIPESPTIGSIVLALFTLIVPILERLFVPAFVWLGLDVEEDLEEGEMVPNKPEVDTVGAFVKKIVRGTTDFNTLATNKNPDIVFKDEEGTGADMKMTTKLSSKCDDLARLVKQEWPTLKLRVTEAWDEDDEHSPKSLHYEARSVDLTTSDKDGAKLGRLGRLAVKAGFGWVYFEGNHIHASVPK